MLRGLRWSLRDRVASPLSAVRPIARVLELAPNAGERLVGLAALTLDAEYDFGIAIECVIERGERVLVPRPGLVQLRRETPLLLALGPELFGADELAPVEGAHRLALLLRFAELLDQVATGIAFHLDGGVEIDDVRPGPWSSWSCAFLLMFHSCPFLIVAVLG
jgi:hypothetical protein